MTSTEAMFYQLKKLKGKPLKYKLEYICTYFWIPLLVTLAVLIFSVSYIVHIATMKDPALSVACINAITDHEKTDAYAQKFAESVGIDTQEYEVRISPDIVVSQGDLTTSYESSMILMAQIAAQSIDVMAGTQETMTQYFYQDFMADLTEIMSAEQQDRYREYFLYMDLAVMDKLEESLDSDFQYPDPAKPEEMEHPVPVALMLPPDGSFTELCYPHVTDRAVVSVVVNSLNIPYALAFLDHIMK